MLLKPVAPHELRGVWSWIKAGLEETIEKCGEDYLAEDVYVSIRGGVSFLYTIEDKGFVILQKHTDPHGPVLFVWCIWGVGMMPQADQIMAELDELARGIGARLLRHHSPLKAWTRLGYFKPVSTVYERKL